MVQEISRRESTKDLACPGHVCIAASDEKIRQVEITSRANRGIQLRELCQILSISVGTFHSIIHSLDYHKFAAQLISRMLTVEQQIVV